MNYYVMCKLDNTMDDDGEYTITGKYVLATSRPFVTFEIAENYASGIAPSREPKILLEVHALPDNGAAG